MGLFKEYIEAGINGPQLDIARRAQLKRIGELRQSAVVTYAARIASLPQQVDISVSYDDILPFKDVLDGITGERVTVLLETPGGSGEVGRDMVELLHERFKHVTFLVPGMAKSTGTIMCLGGHEILMGPTSSLGPIDAQLLQDGKRFSADALLEGFKSIKEEVEKANGQLNSAYIPMLQRISPGELQNAQNALEFARATVADWLAKYKFSDWTKDGLPVSDDKKRDRARHIADELAKQSKWYSHGRSLRIPDLERLGLKIDDFSKNAELNDAVMRYHVLLRMTFEGGAVYKIYETPDATIAKRFQVPALNPEQAANLFGAMQAAPTVQVEVTCTQCGAKSNVQLDFAPEQPLQPGSVRYPDQGTIPCPRCKSPIPLVPIRADIENRFGRKALTPQPKN